MSADVEITVTISENGLSREKTILKEFAEGLPGFIGWNEYIKHTVLHLEKELAKGEACDLCGRLTSDPVQTVNSWDGSPEIMCKKCYVSDGEEKPEQCRHGHRFDAFGNIKCDACAKDAIARGPCPNCGNTLLNKDTTGLVVCHAPGCAYYCYTG